MRHGKKVNHLGRKAAHRRSMLANMACSLIEHKRINTTVAKAKALKQFLEPLITKSKAENNVTAEKGTHNRRIVFKNLRDKAAVSELFSSVSEKVGDRPGGYTRIIKLGNRSGDNADMAMIELVDFNEIYNAGKPKKKKSTRRGGGKKTEDSAVTARGKEKTKPVKKETATKAKDEPKPEAKEEVKASEEQAEEEPKAEVKAGEAEATETPASAEPEKADEPKPAEETKAEEAENAEETKAEAEKEEDKGESKKDDSKE
jgi:large subunit ribosomal protein L17